MSANLTLARLNVLFGADDSELREALQGASDRLQSAGRSMQRVGRTLSTRVTLPLAAIGAASVKMASDAEEAANKFDVVMGDSADSVRRRFAALHDVIPLTSAQMEGLAAGIQDLLVPMGVASGEAAGMSADMVELAADLGSFNNVAPDQVLEAMKSALAGSSEPMRRFGVDTRVAALEAIALEEGLIGANEKLNQTAAAQAVMIAIQRDSTDAMGDAARTVDSTANQMKFFARNVKELGITIGQILIPAVTPLIQKLGSVLQWLQDLDPATQKIIVGVAALAAAIGPLLVVLGTLSVAIGAISVPVLAASAAFGAIVAAGVAVIDNWAVLKFEAQQVAAAVQGMVTALWDELIGRFGRIVDGVREKTEAVAGFFRDLRDRVVGNSFIPDMVDGIAREMERLDDAMANKVKRTTDRAADALFDFAMGSEDAISNFVESALKDLARLIARMLFFRALSAAIGVFSGGAGTAIQVGAPAGTGGGVFASVQGPGAGVLSASTTAGISATTGGGGSADIAAAILERTGDLQLPSPEAAATSDWYRRVLSEMVQDGRSRGVDI